MLKKLSRRDRIALGIGLGAAALFLLLNFGLLPLLDQLHASPEAIQQSEVELRREKRLVADAQLENARLSAARDHLKALEAGLLESPSPSLANAEWQRLVSQLADSKGIAIGSSEFLRVQDLGSGYSLVLGRLQLFCRLDQLVDFLATLAAFPKLLTVTGLTVFSSQGDAQRRLTVQLTLGAAIRTVKPAKPDETAAPH